MIRLVIETALALVLLGPVLEVCFIFCYTVKNLMDRSLWMPTSMRWLARVLFVVGLVCDFLYNQTYGRWWFDEWGRDTHGLMFTYRVQWHIDHSSGSLLSIAINWAFLLNAVVPGHIKRVSEAVAREQAEDDRTLGDTHL